MNKKRKKKLMKLSPAEVEVVKAVRILLEESRIDGSKEWIGVGLQVIGFDPALFRTGATQVGLAFKSRYVEMTDAPEGTLAYGLVYSGLAQVMKQAAVSTEGVAEGSLEAAGVMPKVVKVGVDPDMSVEEAVASVEAHIAKDEGRVQ